MSEPLYEGDNAAHRIVVDTLLANNNGQLAPGHRAPHHEAFYDFPFLDCIFHASFQGGSALFRGHQCILSHKEVVNTNDWDPAHWRSSQVLLSQCTSTDAMFAPAAVRDVGDAMVLHFGGRRLPRCLYRFQGLALFAHGLLELPLRLSSTIEHRFCISAFFTNKDLATNTASTRGSRTTACGKEVR